MGDTLLYIPGIHCLIDINLGKQVASTQQVVKGDRSYRVCDEHVELVERCASIPEALAEARKQRTQRGGAT